MPEMRAELKEQDGASASGVYSIFSELGSQQGDNIGPVYSAAVLAHGVNPEEPVQGSESGAEDADKAVRGHPAVDHILG